MNTDDFYAEDGPMDQIQHQLYRLEKRVLLLESCLENLATMIVGAGLRQDEALSTWAAYKVDKSEE